MKSHENFSHANFASLTNESTNDKLIFYSLEYVVHVCKVLRMGIGYEEEIDNENYIT